MKENIKKDSNAFGSPKVNELVKSIATRIGTDENNPHKYIENRTEKSHIRNGSNTLELSENDFKVLGSEISIHNISYIDGGQGNIISSPDFCVSLLRIGIVEYKKLEKKKSSVSSFYLIAGIDNNSVDLINANLMHNDKNRMTFKAKLILLDDEIDIYDESKKLTEELNFPVFKNSKNSKKNTAIDAAGYFRRMLELNLLKKKTFESDAGSMIVLDGDFSHETEDEKNLIEKIRIESEKRNVLCCGLSKKTDMITEEGVSVLGKLNTSSPEKKAWCNLPKGQVSSPKLSFVKLHPNSEFVFKFQILSEKESMSFERVSETLAAHSKDPVFLGYPYGLIVVDRIARVGEREREYQRNLLISSMGSSWEKFRKQYDLPDAHKILDSIY